MTVPVGVVAYDVHFVYNAAPVSATTYLAGWTGAVAPAPPPAAEFSTATHPLQGGSSYGPFYIERPDDAKLVAWYLTNRNGSAYVLSNNGSLPDEWADRILAVAGQESQHLFPARDVEPVTGFQWSSSGLPPWAVLDPAAGALTVHPPLGTHGVFAFTLAVTDDGAPPLTLGREMTLVVEEAPRIVDGGPAGPGAIITVDPGSFLDRILAGTCVLNLERSADLLNWLAIPPWTRIEEGTLVFEDVPLPPLWFYRAAAVSDTPPRPLEVTLHSPVSGSATQETAVRLEGVITAPPGIMGAWAQVNGGPAFPVAPDPDGHFSFLLPLDTGGAHPVLNENLIRVWVVDPLGALAEAQVPVTYVRPYEQGAVVVQFQEGTPPQIVLMINTIVGTVIRDVIEPLDMYLVDIVSGVEVLVAIAQYHSFPEVLFAEPNYFVQPDQGIPTAPNDPLFPQQASLQPAWPFAWSMASGTTSTVIAVVDSGIDHTHPDLIDNLWVNQRELPPALRATGDVDGDGFATLADANLPAGRPIFAAFGVVDANGDGRIDGRELLASPVADGIDTDLNGFVDDLIGYSMTNIPASGELPNPDPMDCVGLCRAQGHGTAVAGILGATGNNLQGVCGANWRTQIMALRVEDRTTGFFNTWAISQAMVYAAGRGARIANNSFSLYTPTPPQAWFGPNGAYNFAAWLGMLVACSAGNQGLDNDVNPHWPGNLSALLGGVVQVAAHRPDLQLARLPGDFFNSSFGRATVNIAAPGTASFVYSTRATTQATSPGLQPTLWSISYGPFYGTSAATPHVAGLGSLVLALNPNFMGPAVKRFILGGALPIDIPGGMPVQTGGVIDPLATLLLAQQAAGPHNIVTTLGINPNVTADARIFDSQFNLQTAFYPFGLPLAGGVEVDTGDLDGDGTDELLFLINSGSSPLVLRAADRNNVEKARMNVAAPGGLWTLAAADLDGDGDDEVLLLLPWSVWPDPATHYWITAYRYDGSQPVGNRLTMHGYSQIDLPADSTLAAGDVDFDGVDEIVVGKPEVYAPGPPPAIQLARVQVYDITPGPGFPLTLAATCYAGVPGAATALEVAVADVDGDGACEIITVPAVGTGDTGRVYSGSGTLRATFGYYAGNPALGLQPRVAGGDLDDDGIDEILIGQASNWLELGQWVPYFGAPYSTYRSTGFMPYGAAVTTAIRPALFQ